MILYVSAFIYFSLSSYSLSQLNSSIRYKFNHSHSLPFIKNENKSISETVNNKSEFNGLRRSDVWEHIYGQFATDKSILEEQLAQMTSWLSDEDTFMMPEDAALLESTTNTAMKESNSKTVHGLAEPLKAEKLKINNHQQKDHQTLQSNKQMSSTQTQSIVSPDDKNEADIGMDDENEKNHNYETQSEDETGPSGTTKMPPCAHHGRYYCSHKEDYPIKVVTEVTKYYKWPLEKLFRDLRHQVMPTLANDNSGALVCDSITRIIRPGWSKNTNGRWLVVINTDYYQQYITEVICRHGSGSYCNFIPPCYHASCAQRYNTQKLLVVDPWNPYKGPFLSEFLFPSCCICYVPSETSFVKQTQTSSVHQTKLPNIGISSSSTPNSS